MATVRISHDDHQRVIDMLKKRFGEDWVAMGEALGVAPYWGWDNNSTSGRSGRSFQCLREPELFDEAEERERLRLLGSAHAGLPRLVHDFNAGFNNFSRSA